MLKSAAIVLAALGVLVVAERLPIYERGLPCDGSARFGTGRCSVCGEAATKSYSVWRLPTGLGLARPSVQCSGYLCGHHAAISDFDALVSSQRAYNSKKWPGEDWRTRSFVMGLSILRLVAGVSAVFAGFYLWGAVVRLALLITILGAASVCGQGVRARCWCGENLPASKSWLLGIAVVLGVLGFVAAWRFYNLET